MAAKRKKKVDNSLIFEQDEVLIALKERYFKLLKKENIGKTPQITASLDKLEETINNRKKELTDGNA